MISSAQNQKIKDLVKLREAKNRRQSGLTVIEGYVEFSRALESGIVIKEIYFSSDLLARHQQTVLLKKMQALAVPLLDVSEAVWEKISYGERLEGVMAVAVIPAVNWDSLLRNKGKKLFVVLEAVEKPGNLGAILRTCDAVGADGVIMCEARTDVFNPNVIRASLGTVFTVPVVSCRNEEALVFFKNNKIACCVTSAEGAEVYSHMDLTTSVAIVLGAEHEGLSDFWMKQAQRKIKIPMKGAADSLNVSVAAAVILYEALRQREGKK